LVVPAHAAITEAARPIVERYVEATGGRAALEAERRTHARGRIASAKLNGTVEQWTEVPDKLALTIRLGTLRLRTGTDGVTAWETDLASKSVRILDGPERDRIQCDAWFENEMWAREGQGGGKVTFIATSFRERDVLHTLEVTPPVGAPRRFTFNGKTGLIVRATSRHDQHESEVFLSEWKSLAGRKRATLHDGVDQGLAFLYDEEPVERIALDSLDTGPHADSTFAPPAHQERAVTWLKQPGIARVDFRYGGRSVWIKASINGLPPADFLLDTGCSSTAIDREYARKAGLIQEGAFSVQGIGGSAAASFARVRSIRIRGTNGDGIQLQEFKVGVVDLGGDDEVGWRQMAGLIGYDVLGRFAIEIDYDSSVVTFHDSKDFVYRGAGTGLDMRLVSGIPVVSVTMDGGCGGEFLVDVGNAAGTLIHGSLVKRCRMFSRFAARKQLRVHSGGVGASLQSWLCRVDTLQVGPFAIPDAIVGLALATRGMAGSEDYAGNLGNSFLERFTCTFDYARRKLWLEPSPRFAQRDRYSRIGAHLVRVRDRVFAWGIVYGSPADEAGLENRDEVLEIDGRPALQFTPEELDRLFVDGEPGTTHTIKVLREFKPATLTVTLQDVI
jgi:hypothetical protein